MASSRPKSSIVAALGNFEAVEYVTLEWPYGDASIAYWLIVDWFNNRCLIEPIRKIPPAEAEAKCYASLETEPMAA